MNRYSSFLSIICIAWASGLSAEMQSDIRIVGRSNCTVIRSEVTLSDIATVSASSSDNNADDDDAVIALKNIIILRNLTPGTNLKLPATDVLLRLRDNQVDLEKLKYSLPPQIEIRRAGRELAIEEIKTAINKYLETAQGRYSLKEVFLSSKLYVPLEISNLEARLDSVIGLGRATFGIEARTRDGQKQFFKVDAQVEEWKDVPIVKAPIQRGSIVSQDDIGMARLNVAIIPKDAILQETNLIGLRTNQALGSGELFRRDRLEVPPVVQSGAKVIMLYEKQNLKVTASGVALQEGITGQTIKIKNERSKKVVEARVLAEGLVGVNP